MCTRAEIHRFSCRMVRNYSSCLNNWPWHEPNASSCNLEFWILLWRHPILILELVCNRCPHKSISCCYRNCKNLLWWKTADTGNKGIECVAPAIQLQCNPNRWIPEKWLGQKGRFGQEIFLTDRPQTAQETPTKCIPISRRLKSEISHVWAISAKLLAIQRKLLRVTVPRRSSVRKQQYHQISHLQAAKTRVLVIWKNFQCITVPRRSSFSQQRQKQVSRLQATDARPQTI